MPPKNSRTKKHGGAAKPGASSDAAAGSQRRIVAAVAIAAAGVVSVFAVPALLGGPDDDDPLEELAPAVASRAVTAPAPVSRRATEQAPDTSGEARPAPAARPRADSIVPWSADGDLAIEVSVRFPEVPVGATIPADVRLLNHSDKEIHVPAAGEAHPTLALVLVDAEGREVRRIVETGRDPLPRRTRLIRPGGDFEMPQTVLGRNDEPLPPGKYSLHAEFRADPAWERLGLPVWTAPKGFIRSDLVTITVTAE